VEVVSSFIASLNTKHVKVILLGQENAGPSKARNRGVMEASSDLIAFLDADDFWHQDKMHVQLCFLRAHPNYRLLGIDSILNRPFREVSFKSLIYKNYFQTSTVLAFREVLLEFPFDETQKYSEDYKVWLQVTKKYQAGLIQGEKAKNVRGKDFYANGGLSSKMREMLIFELGNFRFMKQRGAMTFFEFITASIFSMIKYIRRIIIFLFSKLTF